MQLDPRSVDSRDNGMRRAQRPVEPREDGNELERLRVRVAMLEKALTFAVNVSHINLPLTRSLREKDVVAYLDDARWRLSEQPELAQWLKERNDPGGGGSQ